MNNDATFGQIVRERRGGLGLTQSELARRAGCASVTIRKIEADSLRPSVQLAGLIGQALNIPEKEHLAFVRLARQEKAPSPIPPPTPAPEEIGEADLSGRAVKGFRLAERIGSGGYGVVYRAVQPSVQRNVAVKIILPRFANHPSFIRRFEAEAHLVARLEHPHIVPLYDYWREPDTAYLIMRLLHGSLDTRLQQGALPLDQFRQIASQIGQALAAAHAHGVLHQDIKPANVLLDEMQNAYLADFGIAKNLAFADGDSLTEEGGLISSPAYVSPEQIRAEPVRPSSDVYCFGLLLFEMLTGQKAFPGPTPVRFVQQHLNEPLPLLRDTMPDLPPALDDVLQRATAKQPQQRYPDVTTLLDALDEALQPSIWDVKPPMLPETAVSSFFPTEIAALKKPYRGLRVFAEADVANLFDREDLVQELMRLLSDGRDLERFLTVVGPSGSSKS
ncbi:MAG: protein kinase, partial [Anaerolineae bacterium]